MLMEINLLLIVLFALAGVEEALQMPVTHSLIYYYTELTKDLSLLGFNEFTVLGLLNGQKLYHYDSKKQDPVLQENWIKEDLDVAYMLHNSNELQLLRNWFRRQNELLGNCTWPCPELHVMQRRFGCEVQEHNGVVKLLKAIEEYGYEGKDFISFDADVMQWKAEVPKAEPIKMVWDKEEARMKSIQFYTKNQCKESLSKFIKLKNVRRKALSTPDFQTFVFATKTFNKITLTCMLTRVNTKDVKMCLKKFTTSIPEHLVTSSGLRPNDDETYQLRKSVTIQEDEKDYNCMIEHSSLEKPISVNWDGSYQSSEKDSWHRWSILVVTLLLITLLIILLYFGKKDTSAQSTDDGNAQESSNVTDERNEACPQFKDNRDDKANDLEISEEYKIW